MGCDLVAGGDQFAPSIARARVTRYSATGCVVVANGSQRGTWATGRNVTCCGISGCNATRRVMHPRITRLLRARNARNTLQRMTLRGSVARTPRPGVPCCCVGAAPWRGRNGWDGPRAGGGACGDPIARSPARTWGPGISRSRARGVKEIQRPQTPHVTRHRLIAGES